LSSFKQAIGMEGEKERKTRRKRKKKIEVFPYHDG
jgi:hypothetical protein